MISSCYYYEACDQLTKCCSAVEILHDGSAMQILPELQGYWTLCRAATDNLQLCFGCSAGVGCKGRRTTESL